ncbi:MAG: aldo/keto reductase [Clostridiales bacterium]|nr:aldo/keto reductase [Clostridiales bacterium]
MQIGSSVMTVDGEKRSIDSDSAQTAPSIVRDRTLLPVRAVVEAMGGSVSWSDDTQTAVLKCGDSDISLTIGNASALLNNESVVLDVEPVIINNRTMLPIRFIAESFGYAVGWVGRTQTVTIIKAENADASFDFKSRSVALNNGVEMPIVGIGMFTLTPEQAENSVYHALSYGYKLIDTANAYNNEEGVGAGIARAGVAREEIFVTTKLWPTDYEDVDGAVDETLERLGLEYIDLLLLHQPFGDYIAGYQGMEAAVAAGKVRSIGLSNFNEESFAEIMEVADITPAVLQVESNPWFHQTEMREYAKQYGTVINAWFPLGGRGQTQAMFSEPTIVEIAEAHDVNPAQVVLRWHLQIGNIAIPGSTNPEHILENISNFNFELTNEEMEKISAMDRGHGSFDFGGGGEVPNFNSFEAP